MESGKRGFCSPLNFERGADERTQNFTWTIHSSAVFAALLIAKRLMFWKSLRKNLRKRGWNYVNT
jgi:hypothetical protein